MDEQTPRPVDFPRNDCGKSLNLEVFNYLERGSLNLPHQAGSRGNGRMVLAKAKAK